MSDFDSNKKKLQEYLSIVKEKGVLNNIGGVLKSSASGKKFSNYSPVDESFICEVARSSSKDISEAAETAKDRYTTEKIPGSPRLVTAKSRRNQGGSRQPAMIL